MTLKAIIMIGLCLFIVGGLSLFTNKKKQA